MANYYVRPNGCDSANGLSPQSAWRTIDGVNTHVFMPGDHILFEAQRTFHGALILSSCSGGDAENHVVISSFGEGCAIIQPSAGDGIVMDGIRGVTVKNIRVRGMGRNMTVTQAGIRPLGAKDIVIDNVEASDFQLAGVMLWQGCENVRITHVYAHDNGYTGIGTGYRDKSKAINRHIYIGYCRAIENLGISDKSVYIRDQSGSGINVFYVDDGMIEYCEAARNGGDSYHEDNNGPVGIWMAFCKYVTIQYCISHHNDSYHSDGGGFDFDSGLYRCVIQYNYSYLNKGSGYLLCAWNKSDEYRIRECTLRYCISENDSWHDDHAAGIFIWNGDCLQIDVYNNVIYNEAGNNCVRARYANPEIRFFNNLFLLKGNGRFIEERENKETDLQLTFMGNCYYNFDSKALWTDCESLEQLRDSYGFERLNGRDVGLCADPQLMALPTEDEKKLTDPAKLLDMTRYKLSDGLQKNSDGSQPDDKSSETKNSPCAHAGINLRKLFGIDTGAHDFYGNPLPSDGTNSIGLHQG